MDQEFKARAGSEREAYKSIVNQVRAYLRRTSRTRHYWEIQRTEWKPTELFGGGELKAHVWIKDSKMTKNSLMKFIDSCIGNIARKIEDEFNESDHPRDKSGRFTRGSGSGSWSGGGGYKAGPEGKKVSKISNEKADKLNEYSKRLEEAGHDPKDIHAMNVQGDLRGMKNALKQYEAEKSSSRKVDPKASKHIHSVLEDEIRQIAENSDDKEEFKINLGAFLEDYVQDDMADTDERATDNFGYDKETVHAVAEEMKGEIDSTADDFFEEDDDTSVTGPEDRDYMNEEDDDDPYEQYYEEGTSTTNLYGDKKQAPAVINALQHQYDGDAKKVGYIVRHLNNVTTNPEIWGEYTVKEIIDDIEDRYGELDNMAKRHIDTYLRKTKPSEWDSETEYWKQKNKDYPGPKELAFYE